MRRFGRCLATAARRLTAPGGGTARASLAALAGAGTMGWLAQAYRWPVVGNCWLRAITGVPCPGCGMGRAFRALALGQWRAAVAWHPLAPAFAGALAVGAGWLLVDAVRGTATFYPALHRATAGPPVRRLLLTLIGAAWLWNLWAGRV